MSSKLGARSTKSRYPLTVNTDTPYKRHQNDDASLEQRIGDYSLTSKGITKVFDDFDTAETLDGRTVQTSKNKTDYKSGGLPISAIQHFVDTKPKYSEEAILVIKEIGSGASSTVYECVYVPTLSLVALKVISVSSTNWYKQLETEIRMLYTLKSNGDSSMCENDGRMMKTPRFYSKLRENNIASNKEWLDLDLMEINYGNLNAIADSWKLSSVSGDTEAPAVPVKNEDYTVCASDAHRYIVQIHDAFLSSTDSSISLVLEHMARGSLKNLMKEKFPIGESEISVIAYSTLRGMNLLHSMNIIHRDIKPANILIKDDGSVKLADFGISRKLGADDHDNAETFVGSLIYMSPERLKGEKYGISSDIWSFGITLHFLVTGSSKFLGEAKYWNIFDTINVQSTTSDDRSKVKCSAELDDLIKSCLELDSRKRPSASQLLQSKFIQQAILNEFICPPKQPRLTMTPKTPISEADSESIITAILEWWPQHMTEMILFETLYEGSYEGEGESVDKKDRIRLPKTLSWRSDDKPTRQLYSRQAICHLSFVLGIDPMRVMKIIIGWHLSNRQRHLNTDS